MSLFGKAFDSLDEETKHAIIDSLEERKQRYTQALSNRKYQRAKVVLLGDTPGPGRPTEEGYHHTPFYSTKNSSLWVNKLLAQCSIKETDLYWFNTTLADGSLLDPQVIYDILRKNKDAVVVCLGGNAEKWLRTSAQWSGEYHKVFHPQAWKRFYSKKPYPLIDILKTACST